MATPVQHVRSHDSSTPVDTNYSGGLTNDPIARALNLAIDSGAASCVLRSGLGARPSGVHAQSLQHSVSSIDQTDDITQAVGDEGVHQDQSESTDSVDRRSCRGEIGTPALARREVTARHPVDQSQVFSHLVRAASSWLKANTHRLRGEAIWSAVRRDSLPPQDAQLLLEMRQQLDNLFSSLQQRKASLQVNIASYTRACCLL